MSKVENNYMSKYSIILNYSYLLIGIILTSLLYIDQGRAKYFYNSFKFVTIWTYKWTLVYPILKLFFRKYKNLTNIIFNIILVVEVFIFVFFWSLIFPNMPNLRLSKIEYFHLIIYKHIVPSIYTITEFYVDNKNIEIKNYYLKYTIIYLLLYLCTNIYYSFILKDIPYKILNYEDLGSLYLILIIFVFIFSTSMIFSFINWNMKKNFNKKLK